MDYQAANRFTDSVRATVKASYLFKQNIDALLRARGHNRHALAQFCRRSDAWLSKILGKDERNLPLKYLDRMADFFGLAPYQLFLPGISPMTERRKTSDRRSGRDRRLGMAAHTTVAIKAEDLNLTPDDVATLLRLRSLSRRDRSEFETTLRETERIRRKAASSTKRRAADEHPNKEPDGLAPPGRAVDSG